MTPKEFERLDREERIAALKYASNVHGYESDTYRALANKHGWLLKQRSHLTGEQ